MKAWISKAATKAIDNMKKEFSKCDHISATLDIWSDCGHSSYLGVTLHTLDSDFLPHSRFIGLQLLRGSHTGTYVREIAEKLLNTVDLTLNMIDFVVTDNGTNVVYAFKKDISGK